MEQSKLEQSKLGHQDWKPLVLTKETKTNQPSIQHHVGFKRKINLLDDNPEPPKTLKEFGKEISKARNKLNITQAQLGSKINIQASVIKQYESGDVVANDNILKKICDALNLKKPKL